MVCNRYPVHPDPTLVDNSGDRRNIDLASPYNSTSAYTNVEANKIAPPPSAPGTISEGPAGKVAHLAQKAGATDAASKLEDMDESRRLQREEKISNTGEHADKVDVQPSVLNQSVIRTPIYEIASDRLTTLGLPLNIGMNLGCQSAREIYRARARRTLWIS